MNKNVLITGASGFIGTHLIRFLLQKNYNVIAVTRQAGKTSDHPALQWVQKFKDISTRQIDYVVNLAVQILVRNAGPSHVKNNSLKAV